MKALSVRAPWWWFILHGGKDIENRDWETKFRGTVLLHSSKWFGIEEVRDDWDFAKDIAKTAGTYRPPTDHMSLRILRDAGGAIVGKVDIVGCVAASDSPWFFGRYGFQLRNPVAFAQPIPFKGALGFFDVPDDLVRPALAAAA